MEVLNEIRDAPDRIQIIDVGEGICQDDKQQYWSDDEVKITVEACATHCKEESEAFFTIWKDHDDAQCSCFHKCDSLKSENDARTYEILSSNVADLLFEKSTQLAKKTELAEDLQKNYKINHDSLSLCHDTLTIYQKNKGIVDDSLEVCAGEKKSLKSQLDACDTEKTLWKNRFDKVEQLEDAHIKFHDQAMTAYPGAAAEISVGGSQNPIDCKANNSGWLERVGIFTLGAVFMVAVNKVISGRKQGDEYHSLLEI